MDSEVTKTAFQRQLSLFSEKAREVLGSRFVKTVTDRGSISYTLDFDRERGLRSAVDIPDHESIQSCVLSLRMFLQPRDCIAFDKMRLAFEGHGVDPEARRAFLTSLDNLDHALAEPVSMGGLGLTRRTVLDTFLYGHLAHINEDKVARMQKWRSIPHAFGLLEIEFVAALSNVLSCLAFLAKIAENTLRTIQVEGAPK